MRGLNGLENRREVTITFGEQLWPLYGIDGPILAVRAKDDANHALYDLWDEVRIWTGNQELV